MVSRLGLMSRILLASSFVIIVLALIRLGVNWVLIEDQVMKEIQLDSRKLALQAHIVPVQAPLRSCLALRATSVRRVRQPRCHVRQAQSEPPPASHGPESART